MLRQPPKFREALDVLAHHGVELIVVGGVAAVLGGAPISTFDLDVVHHRTPANVARLLAALGDLDARYRDLTGRILRPEAHGLEGPGHHLLLTRAGPLDVLGQIGAGHAYEDLLGDSALQSLGPITIHVLGLEALIRTKAHANRDKDRAVLAILRRTLEERGP
jgi:predicted nucleotidyltransferase